jgi:hypothetical protein
MLNATKTKLKSNKTKSPLINEATVKIAEPQNKITAKQ